VIRMRCAKSIDAYEVNREVSCRVVEEIPGWLVTKRAGYGAICPMVLKTHQLPCANN
jgi:hypothetical protein